MKVVKIVRQGCGDYYFSAIAEGAALVVYRLGTYAEAPGFLKERGYELTVFNNLHNAVKFHDREGAGSDLILFWADAEKTKQPELPRLNVSSLKRGVLEVHGKPWPTGTLFAERVKLLREVTAEEYNTVLDSLL